MIEFRTLSTYLQFLPMTFKISGISNPLKGTTSPLFIYLYDKNAENIIPIEVKYRNIKDASISRGFRSFLQAYKPRIAVYLTKSYINTIKIEESTVYFIPIEDLSVLFELLQEDN